jgi:exopolysaccharide biosynthesis polyprenyl glycosylphosphotransferase
VATDAKKDRTAEEQRLSGRRRVDVPGRYRRRGDRPQPTSSLVEALPRPNVLGRDRAFRRGLAYADSWAAALAVILSIGILGVDDRLKPVGLVVLPLLVLTCKVMGLYDRDELVVRKTTLEEAPALFQLATLYTLLIWLLEPFVVDGELGRKQVIGLWACLLACLLLGRTIARRLALGLTEPERCVVLGEPSIAEPIVRKLGEQTGAMKVEVVAQMPLQGDVNHVAGLTEVAQAIRDLDVHRVILVPGSGETDAMLDVIRLVKGLGVRVSVLPRVLEVLGSSVEFDDIHGMPMLGIRSFGLSRSSRAVKRVTDIVASSLGLLAVSPLMMIIAIAIKLDSRGPVFFRQVRVGRDGHRFGLLKFRSMVTGADAMKAALMAKNQTDGLFKMADDPRVTRVGRILRKTALDELPQLINVLRGEMSLVGPRPLVVDEDEKIVGWHRRRLHLTPGMTGPWQILGSARVPLHEMVNIDYLYVANWNFWTDAKILLRTVSYMFRGGGM